MSLDTFTFSITSLGDACVPSCNTGFCLEGALLWLFTICFTAVWMLVDS